jgi:hypothetical protein
MHDDSIYNLSDQPDVNELSAATSQMVVEAFGVICEGLQEIVTQVRQLRHELEDQACELMFDQERRELARLTAARNAVRNGRWSDDELSLVIDDNVDLARYTKSHSTGHPWYKPAIKYWRTEEHAVASGDYERQDLAEVVANNREERLWREQMRALQASEVPVQVTGSSFWDDLDEELYAEATSVVGW